MAHSALDKAKTKLVTSAPFYATIVLSMKTVVVNNANPEFMGNKVDTLATDGTHLVVNEDYFNALPIPRAVAALKHEAMHVAHLHPFRRGTRAPRRWNHATDFVINNKLKDEGEDVGEDWLMNPVYNNMSAEQVYNALPPDPPEKNGGGSDPHAKPSQGKGDNMDNDVLEAPDKSESAEAQARATVTKAINVAKAMGKLPAGIVEELADILDPKVDWRETLRRFMTDVNKVDYSFARPNRRMIAQGYYLPTRYSTGAMRRIDIVIDTSGSVGDEELRQYFGEVGSAIEETCPSAVRVVYCDAAVNHVDEFDGSPSADDVRRSAKRVGGGGTDLTRALDFIDKQDDPPAAVIVLTDGYTPFGGAREYPTLWAITTPVVAPWGETVHVSLDA